MRVGIIGTGHVGIVSAVCLASLGHRVVGTDHDAAKIAMLKDGGAPFFEEGVSELLAGGLDGGALSFSTDPADAISGAQIVLISVGTPPRVTGEANLIAVEQAARTVAQHATGRCLVVEKSTVPTGSAGRLRQTLAREKLGSAELQVASNPEFLREGVAVAMNPDRILVGADSKWAFATMRELYAPLIGRGVPFIETSIVTAELAKHACDAFLALKVSFVNALARVCERSGADVVDVTRVMGADPRIGGTYLRAGIGYGGSCFSKDLHAFERMTSQLGYDFPLLNEIARLNEEALQSTFEKIKDLLWNLADKTVALLGLAYKPGTDDARFAPGLNLARLLLDEGATVVGYDPRAAASAKVAVPSLLLSADPYAAAHGAHCLVTCTEWDEFADLDLDRIMHAMAYPIVVDGRNIFDPNRMTSLGFSYHGTGRATTESASRRS